MGKALIVSGVIMLTGWCWFFQWDWRLALMCMFICTLTTAQLMLTWSWITIGSTHGDPEEYEPALVRYGCCVHCGQSTGIDEDNVCVRCAPQDRGKPVLEELYVFETLEGIRNAGVGQQDHEPHVTLRMDMQIVLDTLVARLRKE